MRQVLDKVLPLDDSIRSAYYEVSLLPHTLVTEFKFKAYIGDVLHIPLMFMQGAGIGISLWNMYVMLFQRELIVGPVTNLITGPLLWLFIGSFMYLGAWKITDILRSR